MNGKACQSGPWARGVIALLIGAACSQPPEESPADSRPQPVLTDDTTYSARAGDFGPEIIIGSRFRAASGGPVYIVNCNGAFGWRLQRLMDSVWVDVWLPAMNACLSPPIVVAPGETYDATHIVRPRAGVVPTAPGRPPGHPDQMIEDGTYRLVWDGLLRSFDADARPFGEELPLDERTSNVFSIRGLDRAAPR